MQPVHRKQEKEEEPHLLNDTPQTYDQAYDDDPEFSSEPMPAAFSACLFLGLGLLICTLFAVLG